MHVILKTLTEEEIENRDYHNRLCILVDDRIVFNVGDGEPEDANLNRDFNDCWDIPKLMKQAFDAGKNGEEFILEYIEDDDI